MIKMLLISSVCSRLKFEEVQALHNKKPVCPSQQYFHNMLSGVDLQRCEIDVCAIRPIIRTDMKQKRKWITSGMDEEEGKKFNYIPMLIFPFIGDIWLWIAIAFEAIKWVLNNKGQNLIIVCDTLIPGSSAAKFVGHLLGIKVVAAITDLTESIYEILTPNWGNLKRKLYRVKQKMDAKSIQNYDGYIYISDAMDKIVNPKHKPSICIEAIVDDSEWAHFKNEYRDSEIRKVVYAGKLSAQFGIEKLIEVIRLIQRCNVSFDIYGSGPYESIILQAADRDKRIRYYGSVSHDEVIRAEVNSDLLINLRPTKYKFTKTTFPSKIAEYMASGTPVLTTKISGIPDDYWKYLFVADDEKPENIARQIEEILDMTRGMIQEKAQSARQFILQEKNGKTQAEKIVNFCYKIRASKI